MIQSRRLLDFPGMRTRRFGRTPSDTSLQGALNHSTLKPCDSQYFASHFAFVISPSPPFLGPSAGMRMSSERSSTMSFSCASTRFFTSLLSGIGDLSLLLGRFAGAAQALLDLFLELVGLFAQPRVRALDDRL